MQMHYTSDDCCEWGELYDPAEQGDVIEIFTAMLREPTGDGGRKRAAGEKPSWKVDPDHERGLFSHLSKWKAGEVVDRDSGAHPLVHLAWRALAIAWQETEAGRQSEYIARQLAQDPALD